MRPDGLEAHVVWSTNVEGVSQVSYRRTLVVDVPPDAIFRDGFEALP